MELNLQSSNDQVIMPGVKKIFLKKCLQFDLFNELKLWP